MFQPQTDEDIIDLNWQARQHLEKKPQCNLVHLWKIVGGKTWDANPTNLIFMSSKRGQRDLPQEKYAESKTYKTRI